MKTNSSHLNIIIHRFKEREDQFTIFLKILQNREVSIKRIYNESNELPKSIKPIYPTSSKKHPVSPLEPLKPIEMDSTLGEFLTSEAVS